MLSVALLETQANRGSAMDYNVVLTVLPICPCSLPMLQGDPCTGNWLSAVRHTPKLAQTMIVSTMSLVAELYIS